MLREGRVSAAATTGTAAAIAHARSALGLAKAAAIAVAAATFALALAGATAPSALGCAHDHAVVPGRDRLRSHGRQRRVECCPCHDGQPGGE